MKRVLAFTLVLSLWLLACMLAPQPTADVPPPVPWEASPSPTGDSGPHAADASPTPTRASATPTATRPAPTPTPPASTPTPTRTPTPEPLEPPGPSYAVSQEQTVGEYAIRLWQNTETQSLGFDNIATISRGETLLARVDQVMELGPETGVDLTGEGNPEAVLQIYTGGAHCCFSTVAYDLGPTPKKVLDKPPSNCDGAFQDVDDDGIAEYATCDDLLAYAYCPYAGSPMVLVIMEYDPQEGYVPASPRFADLYADAIEHHLAQATEAEPGELGEWDDTTKCGILPVVLDYLYAGQRDQAWATFSAVYTYPDATLLWAEVVQAVETSPLYAPGETLDAASWPMLYMLEYVDTCGPEEPHRIAILEEGQSPCEPGVPHRDIYWLDTQLQRGGILSEDEMVVLAPQGCTDNCRLQVLRISDSGPAGTIELDTTNGFPGTVYRVNGEQSEGWRLRGDLTWERVAH
jgi:hypothetical protein